MNDFFLDETFEGKNLIRYFRFLYKYGLLTIVRLASNCNINLIRKINKL
jgi:hypothetical protein